MAEIYCDFATGNDSTGDGSVGNPYKTLQKAIDVTASGGRIFFGDSGEVLTTAVDLSSNSAVDYSINGWNVAGGAESYAGFAGAELDGNDAVATVFSPFAGGVTINGLKIHDSTGILCSGNVGSSFFDCEFYNNGATRLVGGSNYSLFVNCYFHDGVVNGLSPGNFSTVKSCRFDSNAGYSTYGPAGGVIEDSLFTNCGTSAIYVGAENVRIIGNTLVGDGGASEIGIDVNNIDLASIYNNIIVDFIGSGGIGVDFDGTDYCHVFGYNCFNNNATNYTTAGSFGLDLTDNDVTSDPLFVGGGDYSLATGSPCIGAGYPTTIANSSTPTEVDIGCSQKAQASVTIPTISAVSTSSSSIATTESTTFQCDVANSPTQVSVNVNGNDFTMANTVGTTYAVTVTGQQIGVVAGGTITFLAFIAGQGGDNDTSLTQTVTAPTNKTTTLIAEVLADLTTDGITATIALTNEKTLSGVDSTIRTDLTITCTDGNGTQDVDTIRTSLINNASGWTGVTGTSDVFEWALPEVSSTQVKVFTRVNHT